MFLFRKWEGALFATKLSFSPQILQYWQTHKQARNCFSFVFNSNFFVELRARKFNFYNVFSYRTAKRNIQGKNPSCYWLCVCLSLWIETSSYGFVPGENLQKIFVSMRLHWRSNCAQFIANFHSTFLLTALFFFFFLVCKHPEILSFCLGKQKKCKVNSRRGLEFLHQISLKEVCVKCQAVSREINGELPD